MWDILTDVILEEWFDIRIPPSKVPWGGEVSLPSRYRLLFCLDRTTARQLKNDITRRYFQDKSKQTFMSIFAEYGLTIPDDKRLERAGLQFLAQQADHFNSTGEHLLILQEM